MSLIPCVGGALSASPVNSTWSPAGVADRAQLVLDVDDARARELEAGAVVLHVEERDPAVVRELVASRRAGRDRR